MIEKTIKIRGAQGIHARPASQIVACAQKFESDVFLLHNDSKMNAKSIMSILGGSIVHGSTIVVQCHGADEAAVENIINMIESISG